jgi:hypothetical protein
VIEHPFASTMPHTVGGWLLPEVSGSALSFIASQFLPDGAFDHVDALHRDLSSFRWKLLRMICPMRLPAPQLFNVHLWEALLELS